MAVLSVPVGQSALSLTLLSPWALGLGMALASSCLPVCSPPPMDIPTIPTIPTVDRDSGPAELQSGLIVGEAFWRTPVGYQEPPWPSDGYLPGLLSAELGVFRRLCPAPPSRFPDLTHSSPQSAQHPRFTDRAGACAKSVRQSANPQCRRHQSAPPTPAPQQWIS